MQIVLRKNKAQMKISQTAFMLLAVTILFVLVLLFYLVFSVGSLKDDVESSKEQRAIGLISKLASTPEFIYENDVGAVDFDKLMILKDKLAYEGFWKDIKGIEVYKIYPESDEIECSSTNYPNCTTISIFETKGSPITSYVALCRKEQVEGVQYDKCELAELRLFIEDVE